MRENTNPNAVDPETVVEDMEVDAKTARRIVIAAQHMNAAGIDGARTPGRPLAW